MDNRAMKEKLCLDLLLTPGASLVIAKDLYWWHKAPRSKVILPGRVKYLSHG